MKTSQPNSNEIYNWDERLMPNIVVMKKMEMVPMQCI